MSVLSESPLLMSGPSEAIHPPVLLLKRFWDFFGEGGGEVEGHISSPVRF